MTKRANGYATKEDLKDLEKNLKDEMLNLKVEVLGELKKMQEDNAAHLFSHMRINNDIQELQDRVTKIERPNST